MQQTSSRDTNESGELKSNEERYLKMVDEVADYAILLLDIHGNIQNWNKGAQIIKGYNRDEIVGKNYRIFYTEADKQKGLPEKLLAKAAKMGRTISEGWRVRKNGSTFWGNVVITALHNENREVIGYSKVTRDLTEQKLADDGLKFYTRQLEEKNETLRRSEDYFHKMVQEVRDYAIILLDKDGLIRNWNKGAESIKGYTSAEIMGKSFEIFYTEADRNNGLPRKLLETARQSGRVSHEGWRVRKDGTNFWGSVVITALYDSEKEVFGYSKVTRDLTERKLAEDNSRQYTRLLEQKNEALEQFAYVASHDIKEPMRKIVTFGDLLMSNYGEKLPAQGKYFIERMQNASQRMMHLIDDLLEFASTEDNAAPFTETDLHAIIDRVILDLELSIQEKNALVRLSEMPTIMARPSQMQELFQNLISNSLKFNDKDNPQIDISYQTITEDGNQFFKIYVKDNGIGFQEEHEKKIFEIFHRLHGRGKFAGTGIGLAICKKIVEVHKGKIEAEGKEGNGATFIITLPENLNAIK